MLTSRPSVLSVSHAVHYIVSNCVYVLLYPSVLYVYSACISPPRRRQQLHLQTLYYWMSVRHINIKAISIISIICSTLYMSVIVCMCYYIHQSCMYILYAYHLLIAVNIFVANRHVIDWVYCILTKILQCHPQYSKFRNIVCMPY